MSEPIVFYAEFSSPFTYVATHRIAPITERFGRAFDWRLIDLFAVWRALDHQPIGKPKAKARYFVRDMARSAEVAGLPITRPDPFPVNADLARRAFWRLKGRDPDLAVRFARAVFDRYWGTGQDISTPEQIAEATADLGVGVDELEAAAGDEAAADRVLAATEQAIADGCFGTPYFLLDGEPFWGQDRIAHMAWRLEHAA